MSKFKVGDEVRTTVDDPNVMIGTVGVVRTLSLGEVKVTFEVTDPSSRILGMTEIDLWYEENELEAVK